LSKSMSTYKHKDSQQIVPSRKPIDNKEGLVIIKVNVLLLAGRWTTIVPSREPSIEKTTKRPYQSLCLPTIRKMDYICAKQVAYSIKKTTKKGLI
jgi:hypothetical protein